MIGKKEKIFISVIIVFACVSAIFAFFLNKESFRLHFLHTYRSLRGIQDIVFIKYFLEEPDLPVYRIAISLKNLGIIDTGLPDDPMGGNLMDENKEEIKAIFSFDDYSQEVKLRYRGTNANHWNSLKKSYQIKFPSQNLFNGIKTLNLIIPDDRAYFGESLDAYRAGKIGNLEAPNMFFVNLELNGVNHGVYLASEHWTSEWIEKLGLPTTGILFGVDDGNPAYRNQADDFSLFRGVGESCWKHYTGETDNEEIAVLVKLIQEADDKTFERVIGNVIDLKKFYTWNIVNILAGSNHQSDIGNLVLFFNTVTGKFEFIPWDVGMYDQITGGEYLDDRMILQRRIFSIDKFRDERNVLLREYIDNPENLKDDLNFYDKLVEDTKSDFLKDFYKRYTNFQFLSQIKEYRRLIEENFQLASLVLWRDTDYYTRNDGKSEYKTPGQTRFSGSFSRLFESSQTIGEFLMKNPEFYKIDNATVGISFTHIFRKTVIIPCGIKLIIQPGTSLYFDKDVSFVSYSPIYAKGTVNQPINLLPFSEEPWGTFAVLNTGVDTSILDNIHAKGGYGLKINGIIISGMVAFHNSDVDILNSIFEDANDDDTLNVKTGRALVENCIFKNNSSDAIDFDGVSEKTIVRNNKFLDNGGDSIDLSMSDVLIDGNFIKNSGDKGISVGEKSNPTIINNDIKECVIGIAVKDLSFAKIFDTRLIRNNMGISLYRKKEIFGGGTAEISNIFFEDNDKDIDFDQLSKIVYVK